MRMKTIFTVFNISNFFRKDVVYMKRNKVFINTDAIVILALVVSLTIAIILLSYVSGIKSNQSSYWK